MALITVGKENSTPIDLYYEDHGRGQPVILVHGWPLSSRSWEKQVPMLIQAGYRVITYDRRGFGESSKAAFGYDYDTLATDLHTLIMALDLRDVALVGFSMGGGEVARYIARHGRERVRKAVFLAAIPPFLVNRPDNPSGIDGSVFDEIKRAILIDRPAYLTKFLANVYNVDVLCGTRISQEAVHASWNVAVAASPKATFDCVTAWATDFREDLKRIDVPTLILQGDADRILPLSATGKPTHAALKTSRLVVVKGAPHGLNWTHAPEVNRELLDFLAEGVMTRVQLSA